MARMLWLLAVAAVLPAPAGAQEEGGRRPMRDQNGEIVTRGGVTLDENGDFYGTIPSAMRRNGLLLDAGGRWVAPTPEAALRELRRLPVPGEFYPSDPARAVLTQRFDALSRGELDAFADEMVRIVLSEWTPGVRFIRKSKTAQGAMSVLRLSVKPSHGVHYEGAFDAMRRIWEVSSADAPPGQRWDPMGALHSLYGMEPEGRGRDLLYAEIAAAQPPPRTGGDPGDPKRTPWCRLVNHVFMRHVIYGTPPATQRLGRQAVIERGLRGLDEDLRNLPGDAALFESRCGALEIRTP